jgi:ribosomal protein L11 methyltransferase
MAWQQLKFQLQPHAADQFETLVLAMGALSVTYLDAQDQPVYQIEPGSTPLWDQTVLCALFPKGMELGAIVDAVQSQDHGNLISALRIETLAEQDWKSAWMADFHPMQFGRRLWICPSWTPPPDPEAVNILLDPGLAFGTGTHPSTALCLQWLEQAELQGKCVIDYGCGSGVLAIGAVLLGAAKVLAVDNDPQAITATLTNRDHNRLSSNALRCYLPENFPSVKADIIVANILAAPLHELAGLFAESLQPGGEVVLSGLIENQIDDLLITYSHCFDIAAPTISEGWVRLTGKRR